MMMMATLLVMFLIKHSSGTEDIHTVSKISVQQHQTIIIPCLYDQKYVSNIKYVSSGGAWLFSSYVTHNRMSVVDNQTEKFFTATLSNAEVSDTGTYWCGISIAGYDRGKKIYLEVIKGEPRLRVSSQHVSGYEGGNAVVVCHGASQWCQIGGSCVGRNGGTSNKTVVHISGDALNVTLHKLKREDSGWYYCADEESQMPVHITVRNALYTGRAPVPYKEHTTESTQDQPGLKPVLWLVILGVMLPVIVSAAVILIKLKYKRKQRAETSNPPEGMNNQHSPKGNEKNDEVTCENLYEESGMKQNIQENEKNDEVTCENLYAKSGIKQNIQGNEKNDEVTCENLYATPGIKQKIQGNGKKEEVTCDSLYEIMSGTKNIQGNEKKVQVTYDNLDEMSGTKNFKGNEKNSEDENHYEIMTGIKQNMQMTAMDNKNLYESMVRKVK